MKIVVLLSVLAISACASQPTPVVSQSINADKPANAQPAALSNGAITYGYRCKGCHEPNTPGAPSRRRLGRMDPDDIVEALATGNMKLMSQGMTQIEIREVAVFLTNTALPAEGNMPAIKP